MTDTTFAEELAAAGLAGAVVDTAARAAMARNARHARLLRASANAAVANPVLARPWLAPPAYAPSTAYKVGEVVANGGRWYMCGIAGTSPASGTGPTATTGGYVQDGTSGLYWAYLGGARLADPADGAPAVSLVTTNPNLGANWQPVTYPNSFFARGGNPVPYRSTVWDIESFSSKAGAPPISLGSSVNFASHADKLAVFLPTAGKQRVIVDGRYLQLGTTAFTTDAWLIIDWSATSGQRMRTYEVELIGERHFGYVQTNTRAIVTATRPADEVRMVWMSDSYAAGASYGPFLAGGSIPQLVAKRLGWRDCWNLSIGGTGYLNPSALSNYTFRERVPQALALSPDVIVLMGSTNDAGYAPAAVQAEVLATITAIRTGTPAPIIVVGVPSINVAGAAATEAAVQAAVAQAGDPLTFFVPICGAVPPWVVGSWNNSSGVPAGTSNGALYVGGDNVHPPEIGFDYYAQRIERAIRGTVLPALAIA